MGSGDIRTRLIVNADDFGGSHAINQAVLYAHREGVLTTASLMVNGDAFDEAAGLAHLHPRLGVGLHLTLVCGRPALPPEEIPGLARHQNAFSEQAVSAGFRYFFQRRLAAELEREIAAQFAKFHRTGLVLDHVNGHLNMHLHPVVFGILMRHTSEWGIKAFRLTADPLVPNLRIAGGRWGYRLSHAAIFGALSRWARPALERQHIRFTSAVFGLLQNGCVTEEYLARLLPRLPLGDAEIYAHPCVEKRKEELAALISPAIRHLLVERQIQLIRYQDL